MNLSANQLCLAQALYPLSRFPREFQKHQHRRDEFSESVCSCISGYTQEPEKSGLWRSLGSHWLEKSGSKLQWTFSKESKNLATSSYIVWPLLTLSHSTPRNCSGFFSRKQLRDISLSPVLLGDSMCGPLPTGWHLSPAPSLHFCFCREFPTKFSHKVFC